MFSYLSSPSNWMHSMRDTHLEQGVIIVDGPVGDDDMEAYVEY